MTREKKLSKAKPEELERIMHVLDVDTAKGYVTIYEDDLDITDEELKRLGLEITSEDLIEYFLVGQRLMKEDKIKPTDRIRPVAEPVDDKEWMVNLIGHSTLTDPLKIGAA